MNDDLISRKMAIDAIDKNRQDLLSIGMTGAEHTLVHYGRRVIEELPSAEPSYAQSIWKCETCCYWGNRMILRDGSLGDCGNFEKNLSKDFFCAWWSQKEKGGEQDG